MLAKLDNLINSLFYLLQLLYFSVLPYKNQIMALFFFFVGHLFYCHVWSMHKTWQGEICGTGTWYIQGQNLKQIV